MIKIRPLSVRLNGQPLKVRPLYVDARERGLAGDGVTDDTAALQRLIDGVRSTPS